MEDAPIMLPAVAIRRIQEVEEFATPPDANGHTMMDPIEAQCTQDIAKEAANIISIVKEKVDDKQGYSFVQPQQAASAKPFFNHERTPLLMTLWTDQTAAAARRVNDDASAAAFQQFVLQAVQQAHHFFLRRTIERRLRREGLVQFEIAAILPAPLLQLLHEAKLALDQLDHTVIDADGAALGMQLDARTMFILFGQK
jgi:hypothetical protein